MPSATTRRALAPRILFAPRGFGATPGLYQASLSTVLGILAVALFIALNGFFVAAEFSLVKLQATYQGQPKKDDMVSQAVAKIDRYLSVTQLGITLASLGLGWIGEPTLVHMAEDAFLKATGKPPSGALGGVIVGVAFTLLTFGHVLFGELVPKLVAIQRSPQVARFAVWPLRIAFYMLFPGLWLLETSSRAILSRLGMSLDSHGEAALSEDEILGILAAHVAKGQGAQDKQELVRRLMRFGQRTARQAMVPRVDVASLPLGSSGPAALEFLRQQQFSRIPLTRGPEIDEVVGYLYWKDLVVNPKAQQLTTLEGLRRDALIVVESQHLVHVLREMQKSQKPFAVVVDEYGGTAGILTMEDLLEEIVGEIRDESDDEVQRIEAKNGAWHVDGAVQLDELCAATNLTAGEHRGDETLGFAVQTEVGRVPRAGDRVELGRMVVEVLAVQRRRVVRVKVSAKPEEGA